MNELTAEIKRAGVSASEVGRILGRSRSYASRALSGGSDFTFGEVIALRNALFPDRSLEELISEEFISEELASAHGAPGRKQDLKGVIKHDISA